jgi:hypothetical protein
MALTACSGLDRGSGAVDYCYVDGIPGRTGGSREFRNPASATCLTNELPSTSGCQPSERAFNTRYATSAGVTETADGRSPASGRLTSSSKISFEPRPEAQATAIVMGEVATAWECVGLRRIRHIREWPATSIFRDPLRGMAMLRYLRFQATNSDYSRAAEYSMNCHCRGMAAGRRQLLSTWKRQLLSTSFEPVAGSCDQ